jgi:hypothetical protein
LIDLGIQGRRSLHEAIDSQSCVEYLVSECQVDVNAMKRGDWTPIMIAGKRGEGTRYENRQGMTLIAAA